MNTKEKTNDEVLNADVSDACEASNATCAVNESTNVEKKTVWIVDRLRVSKEQVTEWAFYSEEKALAVCMTIVKQSLHAMDGMRKKHNDTSYTMRFTRDSKFGTGFLVESDGRPVQITGIGCKEWVITPEIAKRIENCEAEFQARFKEIADYEPDCLKYTDFPSLITLMHQHGFTAVATEHGIGCLKDDQCIFVPKYTEDGKHVILPESMFVLPETV